MRALLSLPATTLLFAATAFADCTPPAPVKLPDANTASLEDMREAGKAVKAADADVKVYGACLAAMRDAEYDKLGKDITDEQREAIFKRYQDKENSAVDVVVKLAADYNSSVKVWKSAHPPAAPATPPAPAAGSPAAESK